MLEGARAEVNALYGKFSRDLRHQDVSLVGCAFGNSYESLSAARKSLGVMMLLSMSRPILAMRET